LEVRLIKQKQLFFSTIHSLKAFTFTVVSPSLPRAAVGINAMVTTAILSNLFVDHSGCDDDDDCRFVELNVP